MNAYSMQQTVDYSKHFEGCLKAMGKGRDVLVLWKLDAPCRRYDGKMGQYRLEHRWLSQECQNEHDESYVCVRGSDTTLWQLKEIQPVISGQAGIFDFFRLY